MIRHLKAQHCGICIRALLAGSAVVVANTAAAAQQVATVPVQLAAVDTADIVVTARKRDEKLFDVPGPVSAITPQQIEGLRLQDARDLFSLTPSAFLQENNAGTSRDISIRGVGTPSLFAEPGVALYIDDIYSSGFISYADFVVVEGDPLRDLAAIWDGGVRQVWQAGVRV